ncbi:MAG: hypothetical protein E6K69_05785, partial [Nitrospirae bacterium]
MSTIVAQVAVFLGTPLLAAFLSLATGRARLLHGLNLATMTGLVASELALIQQVLAHGPLTALWGLIYIDALSVFILLIITFIGLSCSMYTWAYLDDYVDRGVIAPRRLGRFFFLFHVFLFAMIAATMANSLGVLWVAIEGTTLATTFLIAFFRKREGLEAGWKYLILCSVGIALALLGTVLTYYSSVRVLGDQSTALNVTKLLEVAGQLDSSFSWSATGPRSGWCPCIPGCRKLTARRRRRSPRCWRACWRPWRSMPCCEARPSWIRHSRRSSARTCSCCSGSSLSPWRPCSSSSSTTTNASSPTPVSSIWAWRWRGSEQEDRWERSAVCSICSTMPWPSRWRFSRRGTSTAGLPPARSARCRGWQKCNRLRQWPCSSPDWPWWGCRRSRCLPA